MGGDIMERELISLVCIAGVAFLCPILSALTPNKVVPETVFLLCAGVLFGPHVCGIIEAGDAISLLSDLGLAFLFLLAGYELEPSQMTGKQGRHGLLTWAVTFAIAVGIVFAGPGDGQFDLAHLAIAICLTTTAYGTIVPILHERKLMGTRIGDGVVAYGVWGELGPVVVMALLLSSRSLMASGAILLAFALIAVLAAFIPKRLTRADGRWARFLRRNADTNAQMTVRGVLVLLVGLVCISAVFGLDIVLGSFAAGFVLRALMPEGNRATERKLQGIAYGFFVPLFFVVSGTKIDPAAIATDPVLLVLFIAALLLVRAVPIYLGLTAFPESRDMEPRMKATIALYCTTALPLIVAVTSVAVSAGAMDQSMASVLVAAGAITVLLMPLLASATLHTIDAEMGRAIKEAVHEPKQAAHIMRQHWKMERTKRTKQPHVLTKRGHHGGKR